MPRRCPDPSRPDRRGDWRTDRPRTRPGPAEVVRPQSRGEGLGRDGPSIPGPSSDDLVAVRPAGVSFMTASESARRRWHRESEERCPHCAGSGRMMTTNAQTRARAGGNAAYLNSLKVGALSMVERGKLGGRPKALTLEELDAGEPTGGTRPPEDTGAQVTKQPRRTRGRGRYIRRGDHADDANRQG